MENKTILIVDDEPNACFALDALLKANGYITIMANDGKEAIELAKAKLPHLILLDIMMPDMDGTEVTEKLSQDSNTKDIPILYLTCLLSKEEEGKQFIGSNPIFAKPYNAEKLLNKIQAIIPKKERKKNTDKKTILLVDDDQDFIFTMKIALEAKGYDVIIAKDGTQAIMTAQTKKPDMIILDIGLPAGDGFSVMRRIKSLCYIASTPIIVVTAENTSTYKDKSLNAGACDFFQKPIEIDELLGKIKKFI